MPICKRSIEPVNISRTEVLKGVTDELECVSNNTMVHIVRQLSSLSKLAEDLFSELHLETCQLFERTCKVTHHVELLKSQIIGLNPTAEEVSLQDINQHKPFKSMIVKDQEIITMMTRPNAIKEVYQCVDPPPTLYLLDPYREDGKESMKFYTDPGYFFELWKQEVAKDAKNQMKKQKKLKRRPTKDLDLSSNVSRQNADESRTSYDFQTTNPEDVVVNAQNGRTVGQGYVQQGSDHFNMGGVLYQQPVVPSDMNSIMNNNNIGCSGYEEFYSSSLMSHEDVPGAQGQAYRPRQGTLLHDGYNLNYSQIDPAMQQGVQDIDPHNSSLHQQHILSSSFPSPPNFLSNSKELMNDSNYFPPPPQNLAEMPPQNFNEEGQGFHFSEGVQDLLNLIEGTPPRNVDAANGNPVTVENSNSYGNDKSPTFPADIPAPLRSPKYATSTPSSKSLVKGSASFNREVSPEHLNTSHQRIIRDTRSDLLEAIRKGIQLRKVEERRIITERRTTARFDVQSIMEAAVELRRKAMEGNDSEEDEDDDGGWSDEA